METTGLIVNENGTIEEFQYSRFEDFLYLIPNFLDDYEAIEEHELNDGMYVVYSAPIGRFNQFEFLTTNARGRVVIIKKNLDGYPVSINQINFLRFYCYEDILMNTILEELEEDPNDDYNYNDGFCVRDEEFDESKEIDYN